jgi:hypothetical protein
MLTGIRKAPYDAKSISVRKTPEVLECVPVRIKLERQERLVCIAVSQKGTISGDERTANLLGFQRRAKEWKDVWM